MILWGVIWGGLLGLMISRGGEFGVVLGAIIGALAGWTLRSSVRSEFARMQGRHRESAHAAAPLTQPATAQYPKPPDAARFQSDAPPTTAPKTISVETSQRPETAATMAAKPAPPPRTFIASPPRPSEPVEPSIADKLVAAAMAWLTGGNTVVRIGVVVLFIGLSFLVKYAAENALLPVELRLALVGASGMALLLIGFRLRDQRKGYALTLQGAGVAVLYLTTRACAALPAGMGLCRQRVAPLHPGRRSCRRRHNRVAIGQPDSRLHRRCRTHAANSACQRGVHHQATTRQPVPHQPGAGRAFYAFFGALGGVDWWRACAGGRRMGGDAPNEIG